MNLLRRFLLLAQKKRNKEKGALSRGIFSTIKSKNHFQNSASLPTSAPVLGAFENYSLDKEITIQM